MTCYSRRSREPLRGEQKTSASVPAGADLPDGQITRFPVHTPLQKYSASPPTQIISRTPAIPFPQEGRFAVVTDAGCGMRWTLWRQAREVRADE
jgi:hypothetical protein